MENLALKAHKMLEFAVREFKLDRNISIKPLDKTLVITDPKEILVQTSGHVSIPFENTKYSCSIVSRDASTYEDGTPFFTEFVEGLGLTLGDDEFMLIGTLMFIARNDYYRRYSRLPLPIIEKIIYQRQKQLAPEMVRFVGKDMQETIETRYPELNFYYEHLEVSDPAFVFTHFYPLRNKLVEQGIID